MQKVVIELEYEADGLAEKNWLKQLLESQVQVVARVFEGRSKRNHIKVKVVFDR